MEWAVKLPDTADKRALRSAFPAPAAQMGGSGQHADAGHGANPGSGQGNAGPGMGKQVELQHLRGATSLCLHCWQ